MTYFSRCPLDFARDLIFAGIIKAISYPLSLLATAICTWGVCKISSAHEFMKFNGFLKKVTLCDVKTKPDRMIIKCNERLSMDIVIKISTTDSNGVLSDVAIGYVANAQDNDVYTIEIVQKMQEINKNVKYIYSTKITRQETLCLHNTKGRKQNG
ncbi:hypothetical protein [Cloacibacillus porcorum]|nr:hypothetical protein [Cloacibacillus porcorum]